MLFEYIFTLFFQIYLHNIGKSTHNQQATRHFKGHSL